MKKVLLVCFLWFAFVLSVWAQERPVSGKVTSAEDGLSLPGVNVVLKGTTNGSVTDADGNYKLTVPASGGSLVFSFIGLQTAEVSIGERSVVDVSLTLDVKQLSEIIVTGTGVGVEKRKLAIAVESVNAEQLPAAPTASVDQALIGKIAGAQISTISGNPGAQVQILLRGINTVQRGTQPMILVDGVQLYNTSLNTLDLSAVEKVDVVQGAAAASIYGAQGANGVIQIFTKKGKSGKLSIDLSSSIASNEYLNIGGVRKAQLHAFATDANGNVIDGAGVPITLDPHTLQWSGSIVYNPLDPTLTLNKPYNANLKWYDHNKEVFQTAFTRNNMIRLSGGKDKMDFSFSVSNNHQESTIRHGGYNDRTNLVSNIGVELAKGLTFRTITQLAYTRNTTNSYIYGMNNMRPFADFNVRDDEGHYAANYGGASGVNGNNPNYYSEYTSNLINTVDIVQNFNLNYKFPKFIELDTRYGLNYQQQQTIQTTSNQSTNASLIGGGYGYYWAGAFVDDYYNDKRTFQNWLSKATLTFDLAKDFNMNVPLKFTTLGAYDYRKNVDNYYTTYGQSLPLDPPFTAANATNFRVVGGDASSSRPWTGVVPFITFGYLVNQRIDFGEIGGFSVGVRSDYSSAYGKGSKPFTFPRGDAYFRVSGFSFWDNTGISKILLEWKFRAAYGKAGIQPYPFDRYQTVKSHPVGGINGFVFPTSSANPNLSVEVSEERELGTDMTFNVLDNTSWLNNITLSATYWKRSTANAIFAPDVAPSTGVGTIKNNAFGLASNGIQASLSTQLYHTGNFSWNITTNFAHQTSKITSIQGGGGQVVVTSNAGSTNYVLKPGEKIGQLFGYLGLHDVGAIDPYTNTPFIAPADQANYTVASNGWVVENATKLPYFTPNLYSFGDPNPKFNMSFINEFKFKSFLNFGFQLDWINGAHLYNQTKEWMYRDGISKDYENPISINGETGAWTAFYRGVYAQVSRNGTKNYFYEDASFLRLRNVNVALDFAKVFKIPGFQKLQLVLTGRNLWTKTKYTGMDPEINSGNNNGYATAVGLANNTAWDRGTDHNTLPNFKSYQVGLNIGF